MLALPYVTERSDFQGIVYATEPTLAIAKQFMEELLDYIERCPKTKQATRWKKSDRYKQMPFPINLEQLKPYMWKTLFSREELRRSLLKVKVLRYSEKVDIFGSVKVTANSSGYCLGSCNWTIETAHERVVCVSSSSTFTTHPKPLELEPLKNADVMLLTNLTQTATLNPDHMLNELCTHVAAVLKNGGNVLLPSYSSGVVFDLFEYLVAHLDQCQLGHIPLYFLSPVAEQSLAYANILAEWLTKSKSNRVYVPEEPFVHNQLIRLGRLKHYPGIYSDTFSNDYKQPCVVFAGHPSLRYGDAVHFVQLWKASAANLIVFTEPDFSYVEALQPYQPIQMKVLNCPIDTSLTFNQANKLLRDLAPRRLILPAQYTQPPPMQKHR
jgi:integrator complex subunit 9